MKGKHIHLQIIIRTVLLLLTCMAASVAFVNESYILMVFVLVFLAVQISLLVRFMDQTNRRLTFFLDSVKNEDFTIRFPEKIDPSSVQAFNESVNHLNEMMQEVYIRNQTQEKLYQEILKQADIGILLINEKGHILFANPTIERLLNHYPLNHIKQLSGIDETLYQIVADLKPFEKKQFKFNNERESVQLTIKSSEVSFENENNLLVVMQDIHQELEEKEAHSWVRLIRVLTHEIMNTIAPMTSISASILKYFQPEQETVSINDLSQDQIETTVKGLSLISEQGENLMSFVKSYRTLLSVPKPEKTIVSAEELLYKIKVLTDQSATNVGVELYTLVSPQDLQLFIDEKLIVQVLLNLCKNALYSVAEQADGKVEMRAGINSKDKHFIEVRDNGPGIPAELIEEVFVPFFTTKESGTGIGLSLSKQILRLHGGKLAVSSEPHVETSFVLTF